MTVDQAVSLADLKVRGGENVVVNVAANSTGSLYAIKATVQGGVFQQGSSAVLGATPAIAVEAGATFDMNGMAVNEANAFTIAGAGAGNWPWALTSSSDANPLGTLRSLSLSANATIGGANRIRFGKSGVSSTIAFNTFTLTKTGAGELVLCNGRSAANGTGTFDVAGGEVTFTEYTCLDGYESIGAHTTVIVREGTTIRNNTDRFIWMDTLNWLGGTVTSTKPFAMSTAFVGSGTTAKLRFASGVQATLTGDLEITGSLELGGKDQDSGNVAFVKAAEINPVTVTASGTFASSGMVLVGAGVTLNLGENRPTATLTVQEGGTLAVQLQSEADVINLSASAQPANLIVYDANGDQLSDARVTYSDGTLTIMAHLPTLPASGDVSFDTASNWTDSVMPVSNGDAIIELSDDATITVSGSYTLGSLTITGSGVATFSGNGTITADNISVKNGATLSRNANISATTGISLDSGTVLRLDGVTESAVISGAGAVETYGTVVLAGANSFTGGITAKTGTLSTTHQSGYAGSGADGSPAIVVEDGACVDLANTANYGHTLTIAGKGVLLADGTYSGAVKNSGAAMGEGIRQTKSLTLTDDAMVDVSSGWGLVRSGYGAAVLALNGHTLTMRGTGTVPMVKVNTERTTTGTLVMDGATLFLAYYQSNLTGVNVIIKGAANVNLSVAPSAIGSLTLKPAASGTTATNWNLPSGLVPKVDTSNIDQTGLSNGQVLTLFTAPSGTTLSSETISVTAGGRFTTAISGNTVTATFSAGIPQPFLHYDFNNGAAVDTGKASDSKTQIYAFGEASGATFAPARDGSAVNVYASGYTAYWDTNISGVSPFAAGEASVTAVAKMKETGVILWGLGNTNNRNPALGLVVSNSTTAAVYARNEDGSVEEVVVVSGAKDLTKGYHFYAVVANANGTTLYVDGLSASSDKVISFAIGQQGQFGSFHGGAIGARKVGAEGFYLDDWRVYDAALTADEVKALRKQFVPPPLFIRIR